MGISCSCEYALEPGETYLFPPSDYSILKTLKRKRCCSCKDPLDVGSVVVRIERAKIPGSDLEITIHGEDGEILRAPWYLCEECGDIYFSITELGYCISNFGEDAIKDALKEYVALSKSSL